MERCTVAFSEINENKDVAAAFKEISCKLSADGRVPRLIIFTSDFESIGYCSVNFTRYFPDAEVIGTSSFVNYSSEGLAYRAVSAIAVYEGIECAGGVLLDIKRCPVKHKRRIYSALEKLTDTKNCCCLEFTTAFGDCEELVLDTLTDVLSDKGVKVFGSTADAQDGTELSFVSYNGQIYGEASVFVIIKNLSGRISCIKENIFKPTRHVFTATEVDFEERAILKLDEHPAAPYVAELLGLSVPEFARDISIHPFGRIIEDDICIVQCGAVRPDGGISFYTHIYNYTPMVLLEADKIENMQEIISLTVSECGFTPSFTIGVCCKLISETFTKNGNFETFSNCLKNACGTFLGISGMGEQIENLHYNKTISLLIFE